MLSVCLCHASQVAGVVIVLTVIVSGHGREKRREELACIFGYYKMLTGPSPGLDPKVGLINCRYKPGPQLASLPG